MYYSRFKITGNSILNKTLSSVEINLGNKCNRFCSWCPHSSGFNSTEIMCEETFLSILLKLSEASYANRITFSGFGEPLLNKRVVDMFKIFREYLPSNEVILITNGDYLNSNIIEYLERLNIFIRVSLYEKNHNKIHLLSKEKLNITWGVRKYYEEGGKRGYNSRGWFAPKRIFSKKKCYLPLYKIFIDIDGSIRPCSNNWGSPKKYGNILDTDLVTLWFFTLKKFRENCLEDRSKNVYCTNCDVLGELVGEDKVNIFTDLYKENIEK